MYKTHFPEIPNMGDLLNRDMLEELFGISIQNVSIHRCNMIAIGSGLGGTLFSNDPTRRIKQMLAFPFTRTLHVWGTGFLSYNTHSDNTFAFKEIQIHSLRGKLTQARVEKILGKEIEVPLGDGGLLAERWLGEYPSKKYRVGIIPHYKEKDCPEVGRLLHHYNDSTIIDLGEKPKDVVQKIAECEVIISSSLHGLIVADSFHIPNVHVKFGEVEKKMGDGYKFDDYYSSFGVRDDPFLIQRGEMPSLYDVENTYRISSDDVESHKDAIYKAFPVL